MIVRLWRGWTTPGNADRYEDLLRREIIPGIVGRGMAGFRGNQLLRRNQGGEVEFLTVMWFDSLVSVVAFAGEKYEQAVVPPPARALLARFEPISQHYDSRLAPDWIPAR